MNGKKEAEKRKLSSFSHKHGTKHGRQVCSKIPKYIKRQIPHCTVPHNIVMNTRNVEAYVKKTNTRTELLVEYDILPSEDEGYSTPKFRTVNNKSKDFSYQLDNNPTVMSFVSQPQAELNVKEKLAPSVEPGAITRILQKLYLARKSLNPVIDEIINSASKMQPVAVNKVQCSSKPLCILTRNQFSGAVTASKLFQEVTEELSTHRSVPPKETLDYLMPEIIINMACCKSKKKKKKDLENLPDKIYIDKELMLQLIELYEVLDKTIRQLRERARQQENSPPPRRSAPDSFAIHSEKELRQPPPSAFIVPKDDYNPFPKDATTSPIISTTSWEAARQPPGVSTLWNSNPRVEFERPPTTTPVACSSHVEPERQTSEGVKEYNPFDEVVNDIPVIPAVKKDSKRSDNKQEPQKPKVTDMQGAKLGVLECLKELAEIQGFLKDKPDPEVNLANQILLTKLSQTCCKQPDLRHLHATLNGIPVVLKIKQETVDAILNSLLSYHSSPTEATAVEPNMYATEVTEELPLNTTVIVSDHLLLSSDLKKDIHPSDHLLSSSDLKKDIDASDHQLSSSDIKKDIDPSDHLLSSSDLKKDIDPSDNLLSPTDLKEEDNPSDHRLSPTDLRKDVDPSNPQLSAVFRNDIYPSVHRLSSAVFRNNVDPSDPRLTSTSLTKNVDLSDSHLSYTGFKKNFDDNEPERKGSEPIPDNKTQSERYETEEQNDEPEQEKYLQPDQTYIVPSQPNQTYIVPSQSDQTYIVPSNSSEKPYTTNLKGSIDANTFVQVKKVVSSDASKVCPCKEHKTCRCSTLLITINADLGSLTSTCSTKPESLRGNQTYTVQARDMSTSCKCNLDDFISCDCSPQSKQRLNASKTDLQSVRSKTSGRSVTLNVDPEDTNDKADVSRETIPQSTTSSLKDLKSTNSLPQTTESYHYPPHSVSTDDIYPTYPSVLEDTDELPYEVSQASIPRSRSENRTCSSLEFDVDIVESDLRDTGVNHPDVNIQQKLAYLGVDSILQASRPAKCCRKTILNEKIPSEAPYPPSLMSLPLDEKDIEAINQTVQLQQSKVNAKNTIQAYQAKMQYYTSLGDDTNCLPWKMPVYEVRYFSVEVKPDNATTQESHVQSSGNSQSTSTRQTAGTYARSRSSSKTRSNFVKHSNSSQTIPWTLSTTEVRICNFLKRRSKRKSRREENSTLRKSSAGSSGWFNDFIYTPHGVSCSQDSNNSSNHCTTTDINGQRQNTSSCSTKSNCCSFPNTNTESVQICNKQIEKMSRPIYQETYVATEKLNTIEFPVQNISQPYSCDSKKNELKIQQPYKSCVDTGVDPVDIPPPKHDTDSLLSRSVDIPYEASRVSLPDKAFKNIKGYRASKCSLVFDEEIPQKDSAFSEQSSANDKSSLRSEKVKAASTDVLVGTMPKVDPHIYKIPNAFDKGNIALPHNTPIIRASASDRGSIPCYDFKSDVTYHSKCYKSYGSASNKRVVAANSLKHNNYNYTDIYPLPPSNANKIDESFESLLRLINEETLSCKSRVSSVDWVDSFGKQASLQSKTKIPTETSNAFVDDENSPLDAYYRNKAKHFNRQENQQHTFNLVSSKNAPPSENKGESENGGKSMKCCQKDRCTCETQECTTLSPRKREGPKPPGKNTSTTKEPKNSDVDDTGSQTSHDSQKKIKRFLPNKPPIYQSKEIITEEVDKIVDPKTNFVTTVTKIEKYVHPIKKAENSVHSMRHSSLIIKMDPPAPVRKLPSIEEATNEPKYEDEEHEAEVDVNKLNVEQVNAVDAAVQTYSGSVDSGRSGTQKISENPVSEKEFEWKQVPPAMGSLDSSQVSEIEDIANVFGTKSDKEKEEPTSPTSSVKSDGKAVGTEPKQTITSSRSQPDVEAGMEKGTTTKAPTKVCQCPQPLKSCNCDTRYKLPENKKVNQSTNHNFPDPSKVSEYVQVYRTCSVRETGIETEHVAKVIKGCVCGNEWNVGKCTCEEELLVVLAVENKTSAANNTENVQPIAFPKPEKTNTFPRRTKTCQCADLTNLKMWSCNPDDEIKISFSGETPDSIKKNTENMYAQKSSKIPSAHKTAIGKIKPQNHLAYPVSVYKSSNQQWPKLSNQDTSSLASKKSNGTKEELESTLPLSMHPVLKYQENNDRLVANYMDCSKSVTASKTEKNEPIGHPCLSTDEPISTSTKAKTSRLKISSAQHMQIEPMFIRDLSSWQMSSKEYPEDSDHSDFKVRPFDSQNSICSTEDSDGSVSEQSSTFKICNIDPEELRICRYCNHKGASQFLYRVHDLGGKWPANKKLKTKKRDKFEKLLKVPDEFHSVDTNGNLYHDKTILKDLLFKNDGSKKKSIKNKKIKLEGKNAEVRGLDAGKQFKIKSKPEVKTSYLKQFFYATKNVAANIQTKFSEKRSYTTTPLTDEINNNIPKEQFAEPMHFPFVKYIELTKSNHCKSFENNKDIDINTNLNLKELSYFETITAKNEVSANVVHPVNNHNGHVIVMVASNKNKSVQGTDTNRWCRCSDMAGMDYGEQPAKLMGPSNMKPNRKPSSEKEGYLSWNKTKPPKKENSDTNTGLGRNISFNHMNTSTNTPYPYPKKSKSNHYSNESDSYSSRQSSRDSLYSNASQRSDKNKPTKKKCSNTWCCSKSKNQKTANTPANTSKSVKLPNANSTLKDSSKPREFNTSNLNNLYIEPPENRIDNNSLWAPEDNLMFNRDQGKSRNPQKQKKIIKKKDSEVTLKDVQGPMTISMNQLTNKNRDQTYNDRQRGDGKRKPTRLCWALAQINLYNGGIREFEIMEVSSSPPGQYLVVNKNTLMLLETEALQKSKK